MNKLCLVIFMSLIFVACSPDQAMNEKQESSLSPEFGLWKVTFMSQKHAIPIKMLLEEDSISFFNASEKVSFPIRFYGDSFYVAISNFDSHLEGVIQLKDQMKGVFVKDYTEDYSIPFIADRSDSNAFEIQNSTFDQVKNTYAVSIYDGDKITPAIGIFDQEDQFIQASFATETGDYRFLAGIINGDKLSMSKFDGSSLQLFTATISGDSLVNGTFISGKGGNYTWNASYSPDYKLRDPEGLTRLKEDNLPFEFTATSLDNMPVSLNDKSFESKVKIIQITGTWCPNCLDETRYFKKLYDKYKDKGLEIIAVAFENGNDTLEVLQKLKRYKENNGIEYTLLYGGRSSNTNAEEVFPMLTEVMSFPTAIYLDRNNEVQKIYSGFYGPGTGEYYIDYTDKTDAFISDLLSATN